MSVLCASWEDEKMKWSNEEGGMKNRFFGKDRFFKKNG